MTARFAGDLRGTSIDLPHFWEHSVGSCHATMALRADWQEQLRRAHAELGMMHVRFHGLLSDDMGTLVGEGETLIYSFFNADRIMDFLLSIGMRPFVELSFMPGVIASGSQTVFHYQANVTPPKDYASWAVLIRKLVQHWLERYGAQEVRQWFFEVWNEPNLAMFWTGTQSDYFELYRYTVDAIKGVDKELKVGGPATAVNAWIDDFLVFCRANELPADFITTHHYPNDSSGLPGADTETQLSRSTRSVLRDETREVRRQAGALPVYYTEWNTSSNPRDPMHDDPYAAAFIVKTVMEANGLVQSYSYWTFSDIFEENYFPSVPFHGGFGLLNIHGIAKPVYRAFELLHGLGTELIHLEGAHPTVDAWLARGAGRASILLTNFALPLHPVKTEPVSISLAGAETATGPTIQRIDSEHAYAKRRWEQMGKPEYLHGSMVAELHAASKLRKEAQPVILEGGILRLQVTVPPQSVAAIEFTY